MKANFQNQWHEMRMHLLYISGWLMADINAILAPFELTQPQFNILRILRGANGPLSTYQIRERMTDKTSDVSRLVDRLVSKGWAMKTPCTDDRRLVNVTIAESGLALLAQIDSHMHKIDALLQVVSNEEAEQLNTLLGKISDRYQARGVTAEAAASQ